MSKRNFILYDGRAAHGMGTDDALVLDICDTLVEARHEAKAGRWGEVACYSYDLDGNKLVDEKFEFNHFDK